jgi:3-polyprenyl-4-hydroxybenzoate decarboxylase
MQAGAIEEELERGEEGGGCAEQDEQDTTRPTEKTTCRPGSGESESVTAMAAMPTTMRTVARICGEVLRDCFARRMDEGVVGF